MEEWRPVVGYEEWYEVSSHGRVASLERVEFYPSRLGRMFVRIRPYKVLKDRVGRAGYPTIGLHKNGEVNGTSLLSEEDVIEIVSLLGTMPQTEIGKLFDVSNHTIHKIKCGKNWSWLTGLGKEGFAGAMSN